LSTTRNTKGRGTRRKIATTRTLRRKIAGTGRSTARQPSGIEARLVFRIVAGAGSALLLLTILMVLPWRWLAPPTSAFMLREQVFNAKAIQYRWVSWDRISPYLSIAVVASEDQKFPVHHGFDFESILQAMEEKKNRRRGASTISQQVAKNLFLWPGRSYVRKGIEAYYTFLIESLWPKRRILEIYLNVAEFGPGTFGAEAASRRFFHKPASRLSLWEASLMAAVLPNPKKMSAGRPSTYVSGRAMEIRTWVRKLGGARYLSGL